jgi:hypothetical protein
VILVALFVGVELYSALSRNSDFDWHYRLGEALLDGRLDQFICHWYMLGRVLFNAGLALLTTELAKLLCLLAAVLATIWSFRAWHRMARPHVSNDIGLAAAFLTLLACFTYVQRDLDECGAQLLVVYLLTAAAWSLWRERHAAAGLCLAAAITYKTTPVIFLPFLLWKRQWKCAAWTVAFTALLNLAPALGIGWEATADYHRKFVELAIASGKLRDPSVNATPETPKIMNQSLTVALARLVQTYPPGHSLYVEHPLYVQFFDLSVDHARQVVKGATLLLLAIGAWITRRSWSASPGRASFPLEWAAVMILTMLLSPICWKQHLVVVLPAVFLVIRHELAAPETSRWRRWLLGCASLVVLVSTRDLLGPHADVVHSYKVFTIASLVTIVLVLSLRKSVERAAAVATTESQSSSRIRGGLANAA